MAQMGFPISECRPLFALHRDCPSQTQTPTLSMRLILKGVKADSLRIPAWVDP
jgi:hypothetical protein